MNTGKMVSNQPDSIKPVWEYTIPEGTRLSGKIKLNPRSKTLTGKTIVLTWNHKPNGDIFLERLAELLLRDVGVNTVIRLWEIEPSTAKISKKPEVSRELAETVRSYKPDLVINAQCD